MAFAAAFRDSPAARFWACPGIQILFRQYGLPFRKSAAADVPSAEIRILRG